MAKRTFEQDWAIMQAQGYQYGEDALEQVRFGWELRHDAISLNERIVELYLEFCNKCNPVGECCYLPLNAFMNHIGKVLNIPSVMVQTYDSQYEELAKLDEEAAKRWPNPHEETK